MRLALGLVATLSLNAAAITGGYITIQPAAESIALQASLTTSLCPLELQWQSATATAMGWPSHRYFDPGDWLAPQVFFGALQITGSSWFLFPFGMNPGETVTFSTSVNQNLVRIVLDGITYAGLAATEATWTYDADGHFYPQKTVCRMTGVPEPSTFALLAAAFAVLPLLPERSHRTILWRNQG